MILKQADDRQRDIDALEALKAQAPKSYHKDIQQQIDAIYRGIQGERDAAHFINREFGTAKRMAVIHDVRLEHDGDVAQFDHIVIHRIQGTAWVLETKNFSGRLSCDQHGDWTVWYGSKPQPVPSPINQARRHCKFLKNWLKRHGIKNLHTIIPVVLISPTSSVNRKHLTPVVHVVKSDNFGEWWSKETDAMGVGTTLFKMGHWVLNNMSEDDMILLGKRLAGSHRPAQYDWRAMLRLPKDLDVKVPSPYAAVASEKSKPKPQRQAPVPIAEMPLPSATDRPPEISSSARDVIDRALEAKIIDTPYGNITVTRLPDGRIAIRNEKNDDLIAKVKAACKSAGGQWNGRFSNWIIGEEHLPTVLHAVS